MTRFARWALRSTAADGSPTACSSAVRRRRGFQASGYVEVAFNCAWAVADPMQYAAVFVRFDQCLRERRFAEPVAYQWEVCPTRFLDAGVSGYAADISMITRHLPARAQAEACWRAALAPLADVLGSVPALAGAPIYRSPA
jgi:hypothetical protein